MLPRNIRFSSINPEFIQRPEMFCIYLWQEWLFFKLQQLYLASLYCLQLICFCNQTYEKSNYHSPINSNKTGLLYMCCVKNARARTPVLGGGLILPPGKVCLASSPRSPDSPLGGRISLLKRRHQLSSLPLKQQETVDGRTSH